MDECPFRRAAIRVRLLRPVLPRMLWTWSFTVATEMLRRSAISALLSPAATRCATSFSRFVRSPSVFGTDADVGTRSTTIGDPISAVAPKSIVRPDSSVRSRRSATMCDIGTPRPLSACMALTICRNLPSDSASRCGKRPTISPILIALQIAEKE